MKKSYFIIYLVVISVVLIILGGRKYQQYEKNKHPVATNEVITNPTATDKLVAKYLDELKQSPNTTRFQLELASAYIQKSRETGDAAYYNKIDTLMDAVQAREPNNPDMLATRGIISLSRHRFVDALDLGKRASSIIPDKALYYGIIADAQTELGDYDAAVASLQTMVDKRPDYSSYSRIAYARELHGDIAGARTAIQTAVQEGAAFPENVAWGYVELGKLDLRSDITKAEQQFNLALQIAPNYTPAYEQLGRVAYAKGDTASALKDFQKAFDAIPLAQYAIDLAEVYGQTGDKTKAEQYYSLVQLAFDKSTASGVKTELESSLFLSEHGLDPKRSLQLAMQAYKDRPGINGADSLAWASYVNGQMDNAQTAIKQALRLGENDPLIVFHAGMIAEAKGQTDQAKGYYKKAVALNPHFSILYSKVAADKAK